MGFPHQFNPCACHSSLKGCSTDHQPDNRWGPFQRAGNDFSSFKPQVFKVRHVQTDSFLPLTHLGIRASDKRLTRALSCAWSRQERLVPLSRAWGGPWVLEKVGRTLRWVEVVLVSLSITTIRLAGSLGAVGIGEGGGSSQVVTERCQVGMGGPGEELFLAARFC